MVVLMRSRNYGIFFHASNCSKDVINTLAKAHICVSYDSTLAAVGSLTEDATRIVPEAVLNNNWYIVYDNINFYITVTDQRVDNADTQVNGATATIVPCEDLGIADRPYNPQATLTMDNFLPDGQAEEDAAVASRFYLVGAIFDQGMHDERDDNENLGEFSESETDYNTESGEENEDGKVSSDRELV
ncbi:hypothetical protein BKA57DRAFT_522345 [Linnemannia elongata]|nr:hypothetical protein BKA57DRAFT_522345 [Linnemannia elongata]